MLKMKTIQEVFKDCENISSILNCEIENMNLYKKSNKLELKLISRQKINIKDISIFETYLKKKFQLEKIVIEVSYQEAVEYNIQEEWNGIANYIGESYPAAKAILTNSKVQIIENKVELTLNKAGITLLHALKIDAEIQELISRIYGKSYLITYQEKQEEHEFEEYVKKAETEAIKKAREFVPKVENKPVAPTTESKAVNVEKGEIEEKSPLIYGRTLNIKEELVKVADISVDTDKVCLDGEIINTDSREIKNGKVIVMFDLYDGTSTITCKAFVEGKQAKDVLGRIKGAKGIKVAGVAKYDQFSKEITVMANTIIETPGRKKVKRVDESEEKRVELHMHTQMSQMDAVTSCEDLLKRAVSWGWKSIAITDHGVVQAFPDAHKYLGKSGADIKVIYGVEAYLAADKVSSVFHSHGQSLDTEYCILDIETTGLHYQTEKITEFGIIKMKDGKEIDRFECFVNPEKPIPQEVVEVTHITDEMVKDAETIDKVMPKVLEFIGDSVIVAHNANFDVGFIRYNCQQLGYNLDNTYIDTLGLAKDLFPDFKKYKLGILAEKLNIKVENAHRALDDVITLMQVFNVMLTMLKEKNITNINEIEGAFTQNINLKNLEMYHAVILAKNYVGLKNLYKLISFSHLNYFYKKPRIPKSLYLKYSEGLMIGSACEQGELYRAILDNKPEEEIEEIAKFYDYLEIQPLGNNDFMIREGKVPDKEALKENNRKIVALRRKIREISSSYL